MRAAQKRAGPPPIDPNGPHAIISAGEPRLSRRYFLSSPFQAGGRRCRGTPRLAIKSSVRGRGIVIHMERSPSETLTRFDPKTIVEQEDCAIIHRETFLRARQIQLNPDPAMPEGLRNRPADNWRVLLSIADACGPAWGELAREAAVALSKGEHEDFGVMLLSDIRDIFDRRPTVDRLASAVIVADLNEMPHGLWSEWRGPRDDQTPRRLCLTRSCRTRHGGWQRPQFLIKRWARLSDGGTMLPATEQPTLAAPQAVEPATPKEEMSDHIPF